MRAASYSHRGGEQVTRAHDDFDKKFGTAIRLARIKQKLTQTQLGEALGVTFRQIRKYEKGANAVASTRIPDLCQALKTTPDDLFGFKGGAASPLPMSTWTARIALRFYGLNSKGRNAISAMLDALET
jgi:transcriptional regulator with XRE-family HTH domain